MESVKKLQINNRKKLLSQADFNDELRFRFGAGLGKNYALGVGIKRNILEKAEFSLPPDLQLELETFRQKLNDVRIKEFSTPVDLWARKNKVTKFGTMDPAKTTV